MRGMDLNLYELSEILCFQWIPVMGCEPFAGYGSQLFAILELNEFRIKDSVLATNEPLAGGMRTNRFPFSEKTRKRSVRRPSILSKKL